MALLKDFAWPYSLLGGRRRFVFMLVTREFQWFFDKALSIPHAVFFEAVRLDAYVAQRLGTQSQASTAGGFA